MTVWAQIQKSGTRRVILNSREQQRASEQSFIFPCTHPGWSTFIYLFVFPSRITWQARWFVTWYHLGSRLWKLFSGTFNKTWQMIGQTICLWTSITGWLQPIRWTVEEQHRQWSQFIKFSSSQSQRRRKTKSPVLIELMLQQQLR